MRVIAIDPGKRELGWSAWAEGDLVACGLARASDKLRDLGEIAGVLAGQVPRDAETAVVERMVYGYERIKAKGGAAVAKVAMELLDLSSIGAYVAGTSVGPGGTVEWVTAHQWKGEVPKEVTEKRVRAALTRVGELEIFQAAYLAIPKSIRHNMVDGVGIGLFHHRRIAR